jgi:hypothetical protein
MNVTDLTVVVLGILALLRLWFRERLFAPWRAWVEAWPDGLLKYAISCPACLGVYFSFLVNLLYWVWPLNFFVCSLATWLTAVHLFEVLYDEREDGF